jgi:hypothetical protein
MIAVKKPRFSMGRLLITPGAMEALRRANQSSWALLSKHVVGDWGLVSDEDKQLNEDSLLDGSRLLSAYILNDERTKLWVITEAKNDNGIREATTILLPDEY